MIIKKSKQRDAIYNFLKLRVDHPTAEIVYQNVKQEFPKLSLGTVYRNLMLLTELGQIQRLQVGDGVDHFDPNVKQHSHFVCEKCGCVSDLPYNEEVEKIDSKMDSIFSGRIKGHSLVFYGECEDCLKTE
ncbi:Fur family transcriptional regulator [Lachnobacterium bovis]|uniref:Fur family transcriptional regulator, peroxide stress response regulator n=1 Tax=Lachnobacterium bovis TaxID=140626 RepID=A0A1H9T9Z8_9FIRM|nr:transcriptional repressor [Lachnobacterium bovis]SER93948.1 Fur family transcriptional regulator, peroxide stress response regulator [Lachnobacterium bovis]